MVRSATLRLRGTIASQMKRRSTRALVTVKRTFDYLYVCLTRDLQFYSFSMILLTLASINNALCVVEMTQWFIVLALK